MKRPDIFTTPHGGFIYTQPETGVRFHYNTWAEIVENVAKHRMAMGLEMANGWRERLMHDFCGQNLWLSCEDDSVPYTFDTPLAVAGRERWGELHAFTEQYPESPTEEDISKARYWMAAWRDRIPKFGGCACRENWAKIEDKLPIDYSSRQSFVTWAIRGHDLVNAKLGKPIFRPDLFQAIA